MTDLEALERLCRACGIETAYTDIWGAEHVVPTSTRLALLAAMGIAVGDDVELRAAWELREQRPWRRALAPVQVVRPADGPIRIEVMLALAQAAGPFDWRLHLEDGGEVGGQARPADLELLAQRAIAGVVMARYALILPETPPCGYHRFEIHRAPDFLASLRLIVAPEGCYEPEALVGEGKVWGPAVQLYALRSRRNWGIGDFTDLRNVVDCGADAGAALIGLNPLHALFPHNPAHASPYSPSSRRLLNTVYLDVEAVPEFAECETAKQLVAAPEFQARLQSLRAAESVDYAGVVAMKTPVLEELYRHFRARHDQPRTPRGIAFRDFVAAGGEALFRHGLFEALQDYFHDKDPDVYGWPAWPPEFRAPGSAAVREFAETGRERVEFFLYLQWLADGQLGAAGRRSFERHLGVGLYQDLAVGVDRTGVEVWANPSIYAVRASIGAPPDDFNPGGQNWGLSPWNPDALVELAYEPFIETVRANMRHAGALRIDHVMGLMRQFWVPADGERGEGSYVHYPFEDLLGIVALESQRNRCLVIGEDLGTVPPAVREALAPLGVLSYRPLYFEKDANGDFKPPGSYLAAAAVAVSTHDLPTLAGFWYGDDLVERAALGLFPSEQERDRQIIGRAQDRARLLLALDHEHLLPAGHTVHPVSSPDMSPELARAVHVYLALAPSKLMLVQLEDVLGQRRQVNLPGTSGERPNWRYKLALDLEDLPNDPRWRELAGALSMRSAPAPRRQPRPVRIPSATYRLQFHRDFTFAQAAGLVPYLSSLGISHCYASPYLKARAGSRHGYDIVDHQSLNPEIGTREDYERFVAALHEHGMGQIADIVPNHMGVGGDDNQWWQDLLENGEASGYAGFFDIDWQPLKEDLRGKVLSPVLGDHYGKLLESGEIRLMFEAEQGAFAVRYYTHRFPIDPGTYPRILELDLDRLGRQLGAEHPQWLDFQGLITGLRNLPSRREKDAARLKERRRDKEVHKRRLAQLARENPEIRRFIDENVAAFNGVGGNPASFDRLHDLLEAQVYRLANWRVASDEINYRRFFDINDLAGLRTENPEVFEATHRLIFEFIAQGKVDGLRIDHPDGLYDPAEYYRRLQQHIVQLSGGESEPPGTAKSGAVAPALYMVAEKILASHERLPEDWLVHGTTGYDFANLVNGLFVFAPAEREIEQIYRRFAGAPPDYDDLLYESKKLVMRTALSSELHVLANYLDRISESDRHTRDFTRTAQHSALFEIVACFPVYRTYVSSGRVTEEDRHYVEWAIAAAKRRSPATDVSIFDFIRRMLLLENLEERDEAACNAIVEFAMRFQQYTAPVMAKGLEDTLFYRYNRLVSLNEVGGDPRRFAVTVSTFHNANKERLRRWPHAMLCTSSHDTKRSEDVRARIDVVSEIASEWRRHLSRWSRINRSKRRRPDSGGTAPSPNDEYLFYQTLLGVWPMTELDAAGIAALCARVEEYMLKAIREAKVHTSWINPNLEYEEGVSAFVRALLQPEEHNLFLDDFLTLQRRVGRLGLLNSLSQTALKLTAPGVPDIYQGTELFDFMLVDPDNRRPVDYRRREELLQDLKTVAALSGDARATAVRALLDCWEDGRAKLYLTWQLLSWRRDHPECFVSGDYLPLTTGGRRAEHVCAFARIYRDQGAITVASRWFSGLVTESEPLPLGASAWGDTWIEAPTGAEMREHVDILTGRRIPTEVRQDQVGFAARHVFADFPVAVLRTMEPRGP